MSVVTQREVGFDTLSFYNALKNTLRQAPDVILIGEIRDAETMEDAITFAETGHLCLATLHANNANQALEGYSTSFPSSAISRSTCSFHSTYGHHIPEAHPHRGGQARGGDRDPSRQPEGQRPHPQGEITLLKETMAESYFEGMQTFDQHIFDMYQAGLLDLNNAIAMPTAQRRQAQDKDGRDEARRRRGKEGLGTKTEALRDGLNRLSRLEQKKRPGSFEGFRTLQDTVHS
jgi:twitching motility protein PilU